MNTTDAGVTIVGFGPPGLVEAVRVAGWCPVQGGKNFQGFGLWDHAITRGRDELAFLKVKVTVSDGKDEFTVTGWTYLSLIFEVSANLYLAGTTLSSELNEEATTKYEITIVSSVQHQLSLAG